MGEKKTLLLFLSIDAMSRKQHIIVISIDMVSIQRKTQNKQIFSENKRTKCIVTKILFSEGAR
jgi:hypothetical protein